MIERFESESERERECECDWKFVLYFVSLDLDVLVGFAKQDTNQWKQCVLEMQQSQKYEWI